MGPWQPWSLCSASCGEGEQTRRRDCLIPSLQSERRIQTMHSNVFGCRGNKSMITRRPCKLVPCSYFKTELDPSSIPAFSYALTDPAEILHQYRDEDNSAAAVDAYGYIAYDNDSTSKTTTDDDGCSVFNQSLACRNSSSNHVRLRRAIRIAMGEMIYSNWTPWARCSCTTSMHTRYRFCIVGMRRCIRAKGLFPTEETEPCQCGDTRGSQRGKKNHLRSRSKT
ncbi:SCO-spondin-like [Strongylocentrotus purpuratus]|uniref:Uncharacterized protein n=1 Tax=Strongylocentrotus purpuratus TaxID=7668 RepID=A0A7M7NXZ7_STRPU|nr:SCO-spondin-like [Strongylocentrotus purpuratus]